MRFSISRSFHRSSRRLTAAAEPVRTSSTSSTAGSSSSSSELPRLTTPGVSTHLFVISGLVFAIVVVGGLTRLTESGLSITEWNLVTGTLPPLSQEDWLSEYNKYMVTPEGQLMNKGMTLEEFKRIYSWEWGHRFLGRIIGIAFLAPIPYYLFKRKLSRRSAVMLFTIATLIGGQGALGWYMVKSGLTHEAIQARDGVPRVSQYRLAAHLGMAFLVYALALRHAVGVRRDWNLAKLGKAIGGKGSSAQQSLTLLNTPQANRVRVLVTGLTGLVFLTAISGIYDALVCLTSADADSGCSQVHSLLAWMLDYSTTPSHTWAIASSHQHPNYIHQNIHVHQINPICTFAIHSRTRPQSNSIIER